jgi:hypothetical protein
MTPKFGGKRSERKRLARRPWIGGAIRWLIGSDALYSHEERLCHCSKNPYPGAAMARCLEHGNGEALKVV